MKTGAIRLRKRSVAQATLHTVVMMCLQGRNEIIADDCEVHIVVADDGHCTVTVSLVMKPEAPLLLLCQQIQKHIAEEIAFMTPFTVDAVHVVVKRLDI
ncbi:Asp23/Gls24 family envelope stress response protein [Saccharococcus thermophilus]|uniref:Putative alkaline shock family protein YloU n=1 Tax=Saccharococcus thermophilus TaxID=29396 RepID=A0A846MJV9_9BACL|nr:Asp23/Gls24 family envelope stress response protein [Saccharococcus thermophilus]NIK15910.1 putative alkaline shock family protein YloU [Saccharococcus thermophilus]